MNPNGSQKKKGLLRTWVVLNLLLLRSRLSRILEWVAANVELSSYRLEEQHKYGIYFDDDYNYLQHLRDVNVVGTMEKIIRIDKSGVQVWGTSYLRNLFQINPVMYSR